MKRFLNVNSKPFSVMTLLLCDFYKIDHHRQYPKGITKVYSNWTARKSRVEGVDKVVVFGLQYFIIRYLIQESNQNFFALEKSEMVAEFRRVISQSLGIENPETAHIEALHDLGYLPVEIYSLPEGYSCNIGVPSMVITNTHDDFFWLPNFLETMLSMTLWKPSTSATTALSFRKLFVKYAKLSGEKDMGFVDYQGHDFSMRGMSAMEDFILSGMGHLLSFNGTDTIPAILAAEYYYGADLNTTGTSVPATEHSVMCSGEKDGEFETFENLITKIYPTGIVSIVSDTWDLWKVLTDFIPRLKNNILNRDGCVTIRPDSGDPVAITIGQNGLNFLNRLSNHDSSRGSTPADRGVLSLLAETLGFEIREAGLPPLIKNAKEIYGDSITLQRAESILKGIVEFLGLSTYNMIFGIGSYMYEYVTRDTFGFAMKATEIIKDGKNIPIYKDPITDNGGFKKSAKGIPVVYKSENWTETNNDYVLVDMNTQESLEKCELQKVFSNGTLLVVEDFAIVKERVRAQAN